MVDYNVESKIKSQHPEWTKVMSKIPRVPKKKMLYQDEGTSRARRRAMWRPQQKNVFYIKDLVRKFSRLRDVVIDFCTGTCSAEKACMLLDQHRKFVECDLNSEMLTAAETVLLLVFAS